jgi:hypothetical protein
MSSQTNSMLRVVRKILFGNHLISILIDETILLFLSACFVRALFGRSFRVQHLANTREIWRQDSMRLINASLSTSGGGDDEHVIQRRDILRTLVLAYLHIHEQETKARQMFVEKPYRAFHLALSFLYAIVLHRAHMPSFGDIFAMQNEKRLRARHLLLILRSVIQFYVYDIIMDCISILKSLVFVHSTTQKAKQYMRYLPRERVEKILKYDLNLEFDISRDDRSIDRYAERLYHCYVSHLSDRMAQISAKMDSVNIPHGDRDEGITDIEDPSGTTRVDRMSEVRDEIKDAFKHCLQTLDQIEKAFNGVRRGLSVIEYDTIQVTDEMVNKIAEGIDIIWDEYGLVLKSATTSDTALLVRLRLARMFSKMERHMEGNILQRLSIDARKLYDHCDEMLRKYTPATVQDMARSTLLPHTRSETIIEDILDSSFILFTIPLRYLSSIIADTVLRRFVVGYYEAPPNSPDL